MRFGISTLMLLIFAVAVVCGVVLKGSFIAFAIGFMALFVVLVRLIPNAAMRQDLVHEVATDVDAHMLRNYLVDHGVAARVEGVDETPYPSLARPRVIVPAGHGAQAIELIRQIEQGDDRSGQGRMNSWTTILHNCNCHSFDDVIDALTKVLNCTRQRAVELAMLTHTQGHVVVCAGPEAECVRVAEGLDAKGLHLEVLPASPVATTRQRETNNS